MCKQVKVLNTTKQMLEVPRPSELDHLIQIRPFDFHKLRICLIRRQNNLRVRKQHRLGVGFINHLRSSEFQVSQQQFRLRKTRDFRRYRTQVLNFLRSLQMLRGN